MLGQARETARGGGHTRPPCGVSIHDPAHGNGPFRHSGLIVCESKQSSVGAFLGEKRSIRNPGKFVIQKTLQQETLYPESRYAWPTSGHGTRLYTGFNVTSHLVSRLYLSANGGRKKELLLLWVFILSSARPEMVIFSHLIVMLKL